MTTAPRIISGTLMLPAPESRVRLASGTIKVLNGRISDMQEGDPHPSPDLGGEHALILPGFVDAHMHLPQFDSIGVDGMTLLDWLDRAIFPAEAAWADPDHAESVATRAARSLLSFGTTAICAYATVHHEGARRAIRSIAQSGMRAMIGQVLMDRNAPPDLCRPAKMLIAEAASLTDWTGTLAVSERARVEHSINPRFAVSCTPELLAGTGELVTRLGAPMQTHLSESRAECELIAKLFGGRSYTGVYADAGLLGPRSILAHGIWLNDAEGATLASTRSIVAHCPTANTFLQSGDCNVASLRRAGVPIAIGSDIAGGNERSMVRVARAMIETAKRVRLASGNGDVPSPAEAWWSITGGNANAIGWSSTSRLAPGAEADILIVKPNIPWMRSPDPLGTLLYAWDDRWIESTLVRGRAVPD
mgnify:CR=1 FL=1